VLITVGTILQASSFSVGQMIAGRVITVSELVYPKIILQEILMEELQGIGNGLNTATVPTWVAETSKAKSRGRLVATQLSIAAFGIVIAYWMNYGFFHAHGQIVWRFPIGKTIRIVSNTCPDCSR
jgi:MFS family permease